MGSSINWVSRKFCGVNLVIFVWVVTVCKEKGPTSSISDLITIYWNGGFVSFFDLINSRFSFSSVHEDINTRCSWRLGVGSEFRVIGRWWKNDGFNDGVFFNTVSSAIFNDVIGHIGLNFIITWIIGKSKNFGHDGLRCHIFEDKLNVVATVDAHHVFAFHSSSGGNFFKGVFAIGHGVNFTVGEETKSVRRYNIFAFYSIFFFFCSIFLGLFSLSFGVKVWKLSGFDFSDFGVFSLFGKLFGILENFLNH